MQRAILTAALLASAASASIVERAPARACASFDVRSDVWRLLSPPARTEAFDPEGVAIEIARLGRGAVPVVLGILSGELQEPEHTGDVLREAIEARQAILFDAVRRLRSEWVIDAAIERNVPELEIDGRLFLVRVLREVEDPWAVRPILELGAGLEPFNFQRTYVCEAIESAIAAHFDRDSLAIDVVMELRSELPVEMLPIVARAVGRSNSGRALDLLSALRNGPVETQRAVVAALGAVAQRSPQALDRETLQDLRAMVTGGRDEELSALALRTLGQALDPASVPVLVRALDEAGTRVSVAAHWALENMSKRRLAPDPRLWQDWHARETEWYEDEARELLDTLREDDAAAVARSLSALCRHPLYRHELAQHIGPLVQHRDTVIAMAACRTLGLLGSPRAAAWLIQALEKRDEEDLRAAIVGVLGSISGLDHGTDQLAWERTLHAR